MTRLPRNARSEFVFPTKSAGGRVFETRCMFHSAWAASHMPAFRPTRGSGMGATEDRSQLSAAQRLPPEELPADGETRLVDALGWVQAAARAKRPRANGRARGSIAHPYMRGL